MKRKEVEQKAFDRFQAGFHCAEAVSETIIESFSKEPVSHIPKAASGFGGGIGGTKCETCGALTGGVIALGWLYGRMEPGTDKQKIYVLAAEFRNRFLDKFGSTNCRAILDNLGSQENMMKCKKLAGDAAGILYDIVLEEGADSK